MKKPLKVSFIKRCERVPSKEVEGELLLLNLNDGNYFGLNRTGQFIWSMLDGTKTISSIIKALAKRFKLKEDTAKKHLHGFLKELKKHKLVESPSSKK